MIKNIWHISAKNYDFIINNHVIIHCIYLTIQNKKAYSASVF
jgi:hypothetical protein